MSGIRTTGMKWSRRCLTEQFHQASLDMDDNQGGEKMAILPSPSILHQLEELEREKRKQRPEMQVLRGTFREFKLLPLGWYEPAYRDLPVWKAQELKDGTFVPYTCERCGIEHFSRDECGHYHCTDPDCRSYLPVYPQHPNPERSSLFARVVIRILLCVVTLAALIERGVKWRL